MQSEKTQRGCRFHAAPSVVGENKPRQGFNGGLEMRYLLLIYLDDTVFPTLSKSQVDEVMAEYDAFNVALQKAGVLVAKNRLRYAAEAVTLTARNGKTITTDGPFTETKEHVGGFYLIDVKNREEALAWAAKVPSAKHGSIEVRAVWE
jgi:hypothetical protein